MPRRQEHLLVVTHVVHFRHGQQIYAYGPYAREIEIWADLFEHVTIASPVRRGLPPGAATALTRSNISVAPQLETSGRGGRAKLRQLALLPLVVWGLTRAMKKADAIHVRCPGSLGLLGVLLGPLYSDHLIAKYAGQWNGYEGERTLLKLQRWLLRSSWWRGPVTVYGQWPDQPAHVIPFFTSMMTSHQVAAAARSAAQPRVGAPLRILFSGMLEPRKRVDALVEAVAMVKARGVELELAIVGDGEERGRLEQQVARLDLRDDVRFVGSLSFDQAMTWHAWAQCLVLPSKGAEGWPKVVAEGMCHGLVCIAVKHGHVPRMLEGRGILLETGSAGEIADALERVATTPEAFTTLRREASGWARQFSLEGLCDALGDLLERQWDARVPQSVSPSD